MNNENWVSNENLTAWRKSALKCSHDRLEHEKKLKKAGKKQVLIPHPTSPRCFIEKWV